MYVLSNLSPYHSLRKVRKLAGAFGEATVEYMMYTLSLVVPTRPFCGPT